MPDIATYLVSTKTKQSALAAAVGVSRGYLSELVGGTKRPSLELAVAIERATAGAVPATSWVPEPSAPITPSEDAA
jgi:DNA-binding transcriptional regulator YdaS (Cro superfamily)